MSGDHNMYQKAPIKGEGQPVTLGVGAMTAVVPNNETVGVLTTYVERRIPVHLEDAAHDLIDKFLKERGYDPEEI